MDRELMAYALVLRALAHGALGRLAAEPWLHVKRVLTEHAEDDARFAVEVLAAADGSGAAAPGPALAQVLGPLEQAPDAAAYAQIAYGAVKPALAAAVRDRLARLPDDRLAILVPLALAQERHVDELPVRRPFPPLPLPLDVRTSGPPWTPAVVPAPATAARDPFLLAADTPADGAHAALADHIAAGERAGRDAHERPDAVPADLFAAARRAAEHLRHAAALDAELTRDGRPWGSRRIDVAPT